MLRVLMNFFNWIVTSEQYNYSPAYIESCDVDSLQ